MRSFYSHATVLVHDLQNPLAGLMLLPRRSMATQPSRRAARLYEAVLNCPRLDRRTSAMVFLLASGFTPAEVVRLRAEDLDLPDAVMLRRRGECWRVPLTDRTIGALRNYVLKRGVGRHGYLFQTPSGRPVGYYLLRRAVRRAALATFPHDPKLRGRITPIGLAHLLGEDPALAPSARGHRRAHAISERLAIAQRDGVRELERVIPWLFPHLEEPEPLRHGRNAGEGQRIGDPRKAWGSACRAAGLPGLLIHDLRRSAVRNMEQAGVPQSVAMKLTGHKTETVYRRYAIVSDADLQAAAATLAAAATGSATWLAHA